MIRSMKFMRIRKKSKMKILTAIEIMKNLLSQCRSMRAQAMLWSIEGRSPFRNLFLSLKLRESLQLLVHKNLLYRLIKRDRLTLRSLSSAMHPLHRVRESPRRVVAANFSSLISSVKRKKRDKSKKRRTKWTRSSHVTLAALDRTVTAQHVLHSSKRGPLRKSQTKLETQSLQICAGKDRARMVREEIRLRSVHETKTSISKNLCAKIWTSWTRKKSSCSERSSRCILRTFTSMPNLSRSTR